MRGRQLIGRIVQPMFGATTNTSLWRDPALWVAGVSLIFTVTAFWWLNARPGRLAKVSAPAAFVLNSTPQQLHLQLPLVLYNKGAAAVIVENLRVQIPGLRSTAPWAVRRSTFYPKDGSDHAFPSSFGIEGRSMRECFAEFILRQPGMTLDAGRSYPILSRQ